MPPLRVYLSPLLFEPEELAGVTAVVIDQLRASTTICYALSAGASSIIPCEDIAEAWAASAETPNSLLGGERGGVKIAGFDLGNSPAEYTRARIGGKTLIFTTTNGTAALRRSGAAARVVVGALANRSAVAALLRSSSEPVALVCAGVRNQVCAEDVLAAGAIARAIAGSGDDHLQDDAARLAAHAWDRVASDPGALLAAMHASRGGRNLARVGLSADVELCSRIDAVDLVAMLNAEGRLTA